jgi:hypothetical protein
MTKVEIVLTIIGGLVTLITALNPILLAMINKKQTKALQNSEDAKVALVNATEKNNTKIDEIQKVGIDTHTLVNSNMGVQLKLASDLYEFKAATTKLPEDIAGAKRARNMYEEHVKKQNIVDSGVKQKGDK